MSTSSETTSGPKLRRTLTLWDLLLYGVIVIQPTAPMSVYGVLSNHGRGHVVTTILIAMVAMLFTAISYGRMARAYPSAGSAFTYVGQEINPALGYVTGWSMVMDYMLNPIICCIWVSRQAHVFADAVPYWAWAVVVVFLFTWFNILGIRASARINAALGAGMGAVVLLFFATAVRYIFAHHDGAAFFTRPFYDPATWNTGAVLGGTSIAVLSYIGFDGISTLSEEAENPRRNILLATVLTCIAVGILSALQCYSAQLVWPASQPFPDETTAFVYVAGRTWAPMFTILGITLVVANFGSGMAAMLGAARLLFGMGRSGALPKSFFGAIEPKHHVPRNNVIFIGVVTLGAAFLLDFDLGAQMLNFGALIAFMGVNLAALVRYYIREKEKNMGNLLPPLFGFLICLLLWFNLSWKALTLGFVWMAVGIGFGAWKTRGFRGELVNFDIPAEDET
jgi:putrescine importer